MAHPRHTLEAPRPPRRTLGRNVIALSVVSFLTDASSEMIYPLLPAFLTLTLGASPAFVGAVEGAAESTAALLKLASGWWSDRIRRRKPLVVAGYALASLVRPLVAAAVSAPQVLAIRVTDRVGKGIRGAPRDALLADSVDPALRGRAFGLHRAADHAGAVVGPLVAFALLQWKGWTVREVFWLAAVPGLLSVVALVVGVRERRAPSRSLPSGVAKGSGQASAEQGAPSLHAGQALPERGAPPETESRPAGRSDEHPSGAAITDLPLPAAEPLPRRFWLVLGTILLFTLGNSTDAFLLLRAQSLGVPVAYAPVLWVVLHFVKSVSSTPGGTLSDHVGRRPVIVAGWLYYALVYAGFALASTAWHAWALFIVYGVFFGLTEGTERALIADLVPPARRGVAFGWYNLAIGLGALPASLLFGLVWTRGGASAAFAVGAALALAAAAALGVVGGARDRG